jgi:DNA modification methylase
MVRALLNILHVRPGDLVLDPFVGSGTTAVESMLLGIDFLGIDISPLCVLIAKVKTHAWSKAQEISELVNAGIRPSADTDTVVQDFFTLADMVTASDVAVRKREPLACLQRNLLKMARSVTDMAAAKKRFGINFGKVTLRQSDCRNMQCAGIKDSSVDAIVTSPPYSIALDYVKNDAHALEAMGCDLKEIREDFVGVRGKPKSRLSLYNEDMRTVFHEMARVLKPGAAAAVVIGDATDGTEVTTTDEMKGWGTPYGLHFEKALPKIVYGLYNVMNDEKILFFRKART